MRSRCSGAVQITRESETLTGEDIIPPNEHIKSLEEGNPEPYIVTVIPPADTQKLGSTFTT